MQTLQAMSRDIATVEQGIEELKASQAQMAADNASAIAQLKASQDEMAHLVAKPSIAKPAVTKPPAQNLRARPPVAGATRKPPPAQPSVARAHPQPIQLQPKEQ